MCRTSLAKSIAFSITSLVSFRLSLARCLDIGECSCVKQTVSAKIGMAMEVRLIDLTDVRISRCRLRSRTSDSFLTLWYDCLALQTGAKPDKLCLGGCGLTEGCDLIIDRHGLYDLARRYLLSLPQEAEAPT
jgi:hypothetical protein